MADADLPPFRGDDDVPSKWGHREIRIGELSYTLVEYPDAPCLARWRQTHGEGDRFVPLEGMHRWRRSKEAASKGSKAAGLGVQVAQSATGSTYLALATGGAAASATGIGLVVTGAVLTVAASVFAARSAIRTHEHVGNLRKILGRPMAFPCRSLDATPVNHEQHRTLVLKVLPYVIQKKETKYHRKVIGAIPGLGAAEGLRAGFKSVIKRIERTRGRNRRTAATWLAVHLVTHNCALAQAIVSELYGFTDMLYLQTLESRKLIPFLELKMKST